MVTLEKLEWNNTETHATLDTKQRTIIKYKHDIENQQYEQHGQLKENRG
jgi:hypothetical protein